MTVYPLDMKLGERYSVQIEDCCVSGFFISHVVEIKVDDEDPEYKYVERLVFDNGVVLNETQACIFQRLDD